MKKQTTAEKIKSHLDQKGLKYTWLCDKVDVSSGHLSNIFKGVKNLTPELLIKINKALETEFKL